MDPDLELFERWRAGDQRSGQELFERHFSDVYAFFRHKTDRRREITADDLAQQTFLQCIRARDQFRNASTFRTYLFAIARNELYTYLRRLPHGEHIDFEETSIAQLVTSLSSRINRAREVELLRAVLRELPAELQLLLELHYWHELDAAALAEVFEVPSGTIRVRLLRARRTLRERMAALGEGALAGLAGDGLVDSVTRPELDD